MTKKVLVVEDDANYRELIVEDLARRGYETVAVGSGEEALRVAPVERPVVIILDVGLPGIDGWQTLERLHAEFSTSSIPVLLLTAQDRPEDLIRGYSSGAAYYLSKPYLREELIRGIEIALG